jgi:hypothetical protein
MAEGTAVPSDARERVQEDSAGSAMEAAALVDAAWHATRGGSAVRRQRQSLRCGGTKGRCSYAQMVLHGQTAELAACGCDVSLFVTNQPFFCEKAPWPQTRDKKLSMHGKKPRPPKCRLRMLQLPVGWSAPTDSRQMTRRSEAAVRATEGDSDGKDDSDGKGAEASSGDENKASGERTEDSSSDSSSSSSTNGDTPRAVPTEKPVVDSTNTRTRTKNDTQTRTPKEQREGREKGKGKRKHESKHEGAMQLDEEKIAALWRSNPEVFARLAQRGDVKVCT